MKFIGQTKHWTLNIGLTMAKLRVRACLHDTDFAQNGYVWLVLQEWLINTLTQQY
jgi:hypothetical protein